MWTGTDRVQNNAVSSGRKENKTLDDVQKRNCEAGWLEEEQKKKKNGVCTSRKKHRCRTKKRRSQKVRTAPETNVFRFYVCCSGSAGRGLRCSRFFAVFQNTVAPHQVLVGFRDPLITTVHEGGGALFLLFFFPHPNECINRWSTGCGAIQPLPSTDGTHPASANDGGWGAVMKNYTSQSAGQSYSWLCIMLTSHHHRRGDRDVGRGELETRREQRGEPVIAEENNTIGKDVG